MSTGKVFQYVEELDAFLVTPEFANLSERLGLTEWTPVVWIGRLFTLDNDYGEHWFDNWDERDALEDRANELGIDCYDLMILKPERLEDGSDGPCHSPELRKLFWTDVLKSLELSHDLLFAKAREENAEWKRRLESEHKALAAQHYREDLEQCIAEITAEIKLASQT